MIAASRVTYAYARDDVFPRPISHWWKQVNPYSDTPVNAVIGNAILGILMVFLILAGDTAIGALFSIGGIAQFVAFCVPIAIRVFCAGDRFRPGPWNLGRFSRPIGAAGVSFVALMIPVLCLPSATGKDLTPDGMNWTCLVYGAPMLAVLIWWFAGARKWFKGPKVNVQHTVDSVEGVEVAPPPMTGVESTEVTKK